MNMNQIQNDQYNHWSLCEADNQILWLILDRKDKSVNSMNEEVMRELDKILTQLQNNSRIRSVIIRSNKKSGFIVGADIDQFKFYKTAEDAAKMIRAGQAIFTKLEQLPQTTIAVIEGFCLGGGLELALSCDYRIALDDPKTRIGLPEVKLGIQPGWGGTIRLPDLIGPLAAMDMMLTGRLLKAKEAKRKGVVDEALPRRLLDQAVLQYALTKNKRTQQKWQSKAMNSFVPRHTLAQVLKYQLNKKVSKDHYPAPFRMVENWQKLGTKRPKAMEREAESIADLFTSKTSQNLIRVFHLQEMLKGLVKETSFKPKRIHVVGAGVMGGDIAAWCAVRGLHVTVQDKAPKLIGNCIMRTQEIARKVLKEDHLVTAALDRIMGDPEGLGIKEADVIIEAITEKVEAKQSLFKVLEERSRPDAVLATNTSTIPLEEISVALKDPSRLVGIHFFNPVPLMPLVEVVVGQKTKQDIVSRAMAFVGAIDKLPLPVKSSPGFLVNRILMPYMLEAVLLLEEGVSGALIDKSARSFGMPIGPIELADTVGLDVCLAACEKLSSHFDLAVPERLKDYIQRGDLGRKTGQGFYTWKDGKVVRSKEKVGTPPKDIINRLVFRMLNEAIACSREKVVENDDLLDAGSIFGFGFPPFRGGLLHFAKSEGLESIVKQLNDYQKRYGQRFMPDQGWKVISDASLNVA